jgi:hypothetical protein
MDTHNAGCPIFAALFAAKVGIRATREPLSSTQPHSHGWEGITPTRQLLPLLLPLPVFRLYIDSEFALGSV